MTSTGWLAVAGLLLGGCAGAGARPPPGPLGQARWAALEREIPALLEAHHVASVSIAHLERGELVYAAAFGSQSPGVPATVRSLYNVASLTKPVSAEVVLRLAAAGRLALDEAMAPTWTDPDLAGDGRLARLTPRLALSHRSGLPNWRRETGGVLRFLREPGEAFGYSGEGYEYLRRFAERRTGEPFEALAQAVLLGPAGLGDTAYTRRPWFEGRVAVPVDERGQPLAPTFADTALASDLLYTTAPDYARFLRSVLRGEGLTPQLAADRARVQVSRLAELCPRSARTACPDEAGFGLGWEVFRLGQETLLLHTGSDPGVFTLAYLNLTTGSGTVVLTSGASGAHLVLPILDRLGADAAFVALLRALAG